MTRKTRAPVDPSRFGSSAGTAVARRDRRRASADEDHRRARPRARSTRPPAAMQKCLRGSPTGPPMTKIAAVLFALAIVPAATRSECRAEEKTDPFAAEALFNSAKELLQAGDWAGACAKFRKSMALDPAVSTRTKIAKCLEHEGKLAQA